MNSYAVIVLVALLAEYTLSLVASLLSIRSLSPDLPAEFREVHDPSTYARTQDYTRVRTRFRLVSSTVNLAALLGFWQVGGFDWLDQLVSRLGFGPVRTGLLYIGGLALGSSLLHLPFTLYATFVIEERFGFNRTNARTFWGDVAKGLLLAVVLGGLLLGAILFFFERAGGSAWLWCWGAVMVFGLVTHFIAPTWIMPLFNTFTPLEAGELREAILAYARSVAFPLEGIFVIDGSRRSTKANAFFTGFGKHKRIALFDTLLKKQTTPEFVAIVAHEVGHYKRKHVLKNMVLGFAHAGALFWLLSFFLGSRSLFDAFFMEELSVYAGLVFFGLLFTPIEMVLSLVAHAYSRKHEFQADEFAAVTTGQAEPLIAALKKLAADNLSSLTPHWFDVALHHSHPPLLQRIDALRTVKGE